MLNGAAVWQMTTAREGRWGTSEVVRLRERAAGAGAAAERMLGRVGLGRQANGT